MKKSDRHLLVNSRRAARLWKSSGASFPLADDAAEPKHERLRNELLKTAQVFGLRSYDALPSESGLCELYGVSRTVVRQALEGLENDGFIFRVKGKGSFIAEADDTELSRFTLRGLHTQVAGSTRVDITSQVLTKDFRRAPGDIARKLDVAPGDKVFYLERLRRVNGLPWVRIESYIPLVLGERIAGCDLAARPLHSIFSECGSEVVRASRRISVAPADSASADLMQLADFPVLLMVASVHYDTAGSILEYSLASYRADSSQLEFSVMDL